MNGFPATAEELLQAGAAFVGGQIPEERRSVLAEVLFRCSLFLNKDNPDALANLATLSITKGNLDEAREMVVRSIALRPGNWAPWAILGQIYNRQNSFLDAKICVERAMDLAPDQPEVRFILAGLWEILGNYDKSEEHYKRELELKPDDNQCKFSWGIIKMLRGDYAYGLPLYEARLDHFVPKYPVQKATTIIADLILGRVKELAIEYEQGVGDMFQMARYAPVLKKRFPDLIIILHCPDNLASIMTRFGGFDQVIGYSHDYHQPEHALSAMSLMYLCNFIGESVFQPPQDIGLGGISIDKYGHGSQPLIGLCWKGNPAHSNDRFRSIPEEKFAPLVETINKFGVVCDLTVPDGWEAALQKILSCDLVITVDTAIAHLSGTAGKPTWLLVSAVPDWRWGLGTETTPWYANMQIFRQEKAMAWEPVIDLINEKLKLWSSW